MARELMWFGTETHAGWITPPKSGADSSPQTWAADGHTLNGLGYAFNAVNSHKVYNYAWSASSSRQEAQRMKNYADGLYGTGKFFFVEPTIYDQNVLSARWAAPAMTANFEGPSLVPGVDAVAQPGISTPYGLPVTGMRYAFTSYVQPAYMDVGMFVPIPEGYVAVVTAFGTATGNAGVIAAAQTPGGIGLRTSVPLTLPAEGQHNASYSATTDRVVNYSTPGSGVRIWIGGTTANASVNGVVNIRGIQVRLFKSDDIGRQATLPYAGWSGGMGHEGCRMVGKPTFVTHNKINGGQIEYAATFKEVLF